VKNNPLLFLCAAAACANAALAATPDNGAISESNPKIEYTFPAAPVPNASGAATTNYTCDLADPCDEFALTLDLPSDYMDKHPNATVHVEAAADVAEFDIDLQVSDDKGNVIYIHRDNPPDQPSLDIFPLGGTEHFVVQVVPGTPHTGGKAAITLNPGDAKSAGLLGLGALNLVLLAPLALLALARRKLA
jgi:hypothetical protein